MAEITFNNSTIEISAAIIADGLALAPKEVPALMRAGEITGLYEEGADADAGRTRITFRMLDHSASTAWPSALHPAHPR